MDSLLTLFLWTAAVMAIWSAYRRKYDESAVYVALGMGFVALLRYFGY